MTRAVEVVLDPSPSQQRWLVSYAGSARSAYNWAVAEAQSNLAVREAERADGVGEDELTPALSWSRAVLHQRWRAVRDETHPWHREVSIHAFRTGLDNAAAALRNFTESRAGRRRGRPVSFPRFKDRHARSAVTFVEGNVDHHHWINGSTRRHVRLMLPQRAPDGTWQRRHTRPVGQQAPGRDRRRELAWIRAHDGAAVAEVWQLCETGRAQVQALTIKLEGGRWRAVFRLRLLDGSKQLRNPGEPVAWHGGAVGVDVGTQHLATLDRPIEGLTDERGHVPNPQALQRHLDRLDRLDRAIARCQADSNNRARLLRRRAKLQGRIKATRKLYLHELSRRLAGGFEVVCIEDLRPRAAAGTGSAPTQGELVRQLEYKTRTNGSVLVRVVGSEPSSRACSACHAGGGAARTKPPRHARVFACDDCGVRLELGVNAARSTRRQGLRLLRERLPAGQPVVAPVRGETENGEPRPGEPDSRTQRATSGTGRPRTQPIQQRGPRPRLCE